MKKYIVLIILFLFCIVLTGCEKKTNEGELSGGWTSVFDKQKATLSEEEKYIFDNAKSKYTDLELEAIAVIARQVVSGTNYMYLAKGYKKGEENKATYKIVVVYNDLEGYSSISKVSDFDYVKYVNENADGNSEMLSGGWYSDVSTEEKVLDEKVQYVFDNATSTLAGMTYTPIALLASQVVAGTNYAILCYGTPSVNPQDSVTSIYVVTIYEDLNSNSNSSSSCFVPIEQYN
jgi:hypothetical protein